MKEGPDIARLGTLIGDPARANMLTALMSGKALTASELAVEAGVGAPTASAHLARLESAGLLRQRKQGRHRYFSFADDDVASMIEAMMSYAERRGHVRTQTGPRNLEMRKARVCYNHLAGELGVRLFDSMVAQGFLAGGVDAPLLTEAGHAFADSFGIDIAALHKSRRPLCRACLDWSARRNHLAGALGGAIFERICDLGWAARRAPTRIVAFTPNGERRFLKCFPLADTVAVADASAGP